MLLGKYREWKPERGHRAERPAPLRATRTRLPWLDRLCRDRGDRLRGGRSRVDGLGWSDVLSWHRVCRAARQCSRTTNVTTDHALIALEPEFMPFGVPLGPSIRHPMDGLLRIREPFCGLSDKFVVPLYAPICATSLRQQARHSKAVGKLLYPAVKHLRECGNRQLRHWPGFPHVPGPQIGLFC